MKMWAIKLIGVSDGVIDGTISRTRKAAWLKMGVDRDKLSDCYTCVPVEVREIKQRKKCPTNPK